MVRAIYISLIIWIISFLPSHGSSPSEGLPSFRKLTGSYRGKSTEQLKIIANQTLSDCQQLDVSHSDLTNNQMAVILESVNSSELTELNLSYNDVNASFFSQMRDMVNLKTLIIRYKHFFDCDMSGFTPLVSLSFLDLSECFTNMSDFAASLKQALAKSNIETLVLESLPEKCVLNLAHLTRAYGGWRKLKHLNISFSWIYEESITPLYVEKLEARGLQLVRANSPDNITLIIDDYAPLIEDPSISISWAQKLVWEKEPRKELDSCRYLDLSGNNLSTRDLVFLKHLKQLNTLILSVNPGITYELLKHIRALPLTYLDLSHSGVVDMLDTGSRLPSPIPLFFPSSLQVLRLDHTKYRGEYLQDVLTGLEKLKELSFKGTPLTDEALRTLSKHRKPITLDEQTRDRIILVWKN